jgi:hypothetical protein
MNKVTLKYDYIRRFTFNSWCLQIQGKTAWVPKKDNVIDLDKKEITMPYWMAVKMLKLNIEEANDEFTH